MTTGRTYYRTGNKNARNIYRVLPDGTEEHVGCMFSEADGRYTVAALNAWAAGLPGPGMPSAPRSTPC